MRWFAKEDPKLGSERTVAAFLWLPKKIGNETRWFERAVWFERLILVSRAPETSDTQEWKAVCWLDPQ